MNPTSPSTSTPSLGPAASTASKPAILALELLALDAPKSKQGLSLRILMDASAARLMIAGMTAARTGSSYSNGEIAHWMAAIVSAAYRNDNADGSWADAAIVADREGFGSAYAVRGAHATQEATAAALREAAAKIIGRLGGLCLVEYGYCDLKGKGPALSEWTDLHAEKMLGRVGSNENLATTFMVFTDQRQALKSARADQAAALSPAGIIAAALAMEPELDE